MYPGASLETWIRSASRTPNAYFSKNETTIGIRLARLSKYKILWIQTSSKDSPSPTSLKKCKSINSSWSTAMVVAIMTQLARFKFQWENWWVPKSRYTLRNWRIRVKVNAAPLLFVHKLSSRRMRLSRWASTGEALILSCQGAWACARLHLVSTSRFWKRSLTLEALW